MTNPQATAGRMIHVDNVEQAIPVIITYVTTAIAGKGIGHHDLEFVCTQMTTDKVMDIIRASYNHRVDVMGDTPKEAVISIGVRLIQAYRVKFGI
jgi:hypothetical protein